MRVSLALTICTLAFLQSTAQAWAETPTDPRDLARPMGLALSLAQKSEDLDFPGWIARIPSLPRVRLDVDMNSTSDAETQASLAQAKRSLLALAKARWLMKQIASFANGQARIFSFSSHYRNQAINGLRHRALFHAAACLERDQLRYYDVNTMLPHQTWWNWWMLLENGDLILNQRAPEEKLPEGSILRTDGSVELPSSSLPC